MMLAMLFVGSTALAVVFFLSAAPRSRSLYVILLAWIFLQGILAAAGFFYETDTLPPRMLVAIGPPLLTVLALISTVRGRAWLQRLDLRVLTMLHVVRVPVELGLHALYGEGWIPEVMTYEGRNFDIFSGLSAPIIYLLAFRKGEDGLRLLTGWNIICLLLLLNIMFHGILSVPSPFQQFGFEQPNIALLHFPFQWLPAVIVPVVLLAHVAALYRLLTARNGMPAHGLR